MAFDDGTSLFVVGLKGFEILCVLIKQERIYDKGTRAESDARVTGVRILDELRHLPEFDALLLQVQDWSRASKAKSSSYRFEESLGQGLARTKPQLFGFRDRCLVRYLRQDRPSTACIQAFADGAEGCFAAAILDLNQGGGVVFSDCSSFEPGVETPSGVPSSTECLFKLFCSTGEPKVLQGCLGQDVWGALLETMSAVDVVGDSNECVACVHVCGAQFFAMRFTRSLCFICDRRPQDSKQLYSALVQHYGHLSPSPPTVRVEEDANPMKTEQARSACPIEA
jgi:hypothetical protein